MWLQKGIVIFHEMLGVSEYYDDTFRDSGYIISAQIELAI